MAVQALLQSLRDASTKNERRAAHEKLVDAASQSGFSEDELMGLATAIREQKDEMDARRMIRALVPRNKVPDMVVVKLLGQASSGDRGLAFKAAVFKWVAAVLDLIADSGAHAACYTVYFSFLEYETLRPFVCHILSRITRREHVKPFRCRRLMALHNKYGYSADIAELLQVYRTFQPLLITVELPKRKASPRVPVDNGFLAILRRLHPHDAASAARPHVRPGQSRLPRRASSAAPSLPSLSGVGSFDEVVKLLERKSFADQMSAVLDNKWLALLFSCRADQSSVMRLAYWLHHSLSDAAFRLDHSPKTIGTLEGLLERALQLCLVMQETLPVFEEFLSRFLLTWDGEMLREHIFRLLPLLPPMAFEELAGSVLLPLQRLFSSASPQWKAELLRAYTRLLHRWASQDWARHYNGEARPILLTPTSTSVDHFRTLFQFVSYVDNLSSVALSIERDHVLVQHAVLGFFETASLFSQRYQLPIVNPPTPGVFYHCLLGESPMALARVCGLVTRYLDSFNELKAKTGNRNDAFAFAGYHPSRDFTNGLENSRLLNGYIIDMSSSLWVTVRLNRQTDQDISLADYTKTRRYDLALTHSSTLISFTHAFCRKEGIVVNDLESLMHDRMSKDPQRANFRHQLLDHLAGEALGSIRGFLTTIIRRA